MCPGKPNNPCDSLYSNRGFTASVRKGPRPSPRRAWALWAALQDSTKRIPVPHLGAVGPSPLPPSTLLPCPCASLALWLFPGSLFLRWLQPPPPSAESCPGFCHLCGQILPGFYIIMSLEPHKISESVVKHWSHKMVL